jgi:hypothetical protein
MPEPNSMMLPGSGVQDELPLASQGMLTVKASEGIVPTALSEALDGQFWPPQPAPLFSSQ